MTESEELDAEIDIYSEFGIEKNASQEQVRKAYYKLCLKYHPDKAEDKEEMTRKFQQLTSWYKVLCDPIKRKRYDETGALDDGDDFVPQGQDNWDSYFRELWSGVVNEDTIQEFESNYKNSEEERQDLLRAYEQFKGDFNEILDNVILATVEDEDRFISIINEAIKAKEATSYKQFKSSTSKKARQKRQLAAEAEAEEAQELAKELGLNEKHKNDENALSALIQQRRNDNFNSIIGQIEEKYTKSGPKGKRKRAEDAPEISEEAFQELQQRLFAKKK